MVNLIIQKETRDFPRFASTNRHTRTLNLLSKIASEIPPVAAARLASAVVIGNEVVSIGVNQRRSHPFQKRFGRNPQSVYFHSETCAIYNALKQVDLKELRKATLYVARVKKNNKGDFQWGLAKSCSGCYHCAEHFHIKRIIYTTDDGGYEEL